MELSGNSVVVLNEPPNLETKKGRAAIASLGSLCTLRSSATHRNMYNFVYHLDPVRAFELKLVKAIDVDGVDLAITPLDDARIRAGAQCS